MSRAMDRGVFIFLVGNDSIHQAHEPDKIVLDLFQSQ